MIGITGGGTGGHIFPIIAVIEELRNRGFHEFIWIGEKGGKEEIWAKKVGVQFIGIPAGKLRRYFSIKNFFDLFRILAGFIKSLIVLKKNKIDLLFSKGGFVSVPPVLAAKLYNIPVVTHESDITPGLANRINSRFSRVICVSFDETKKYFKGRNIVLTGNPIRSIIKSGNANRGRKYLSHYLNLKAQAPIVLVLGGSLGSLSINRAVWEMVENKNLDFYLIHQCGQGNINEKLKVLNSEMYIQIEFLFKEMGDVLNASDLVVSRAGAGAIYEIGYTGRPAILIPLSLSGSRGEQIKNAEYLYSKNAADMITESELNGNTLFERIVKLLNDVEKRKAMSQNIKKLIFNNAERIIADEILKIISF